MNFWWLSFVDPFGPEGDRFLGVVVTEAACFENAVRGAWSKGINPGGEVLGLPLPDEQAVVVPPEYRERLLCRADAEALNGIFAARVGSTPSTLQ